MINVDSLRIVLNNKCNFRCFYCFNEGYPKNKKDQPAILEVKDYLRVIEYLKKHHGLRKVKLTGGEPFLYSSIYELIEEIQLNFPDIQLGITTNGSQPKRIEELLQKDYSRNVKINISLPSIDNNNFKTITGTNALRDVLKSIAILKLARYEKLSIDTVLMLGSFNKDASQVIDFCQQNKLTVKLLCLNRTPINNFLLDEYCETNYKFEKAIDFINNKEYILSSINNDHSAIFKKNDHVVKVLSCNESQPLRYFSIYKSIRLYFDSHLAVTGAFDNLWQLFDAKTIEDDLELFISSIENKCHSRINQKLLSG
jgi:molybdenum cofactor biosynthesis enzyme MoaA